MTNKSVEEKRWRSCAVALTFGVEKERQHQKDGSRLAAASNCHVVVARETMPPHAVEKKICDVADIYDKPQAQQ